MVEARSMGGLPRINAWGGYGGFGFLAFFFLGFWPLAHFLPGHSPAADAETIASLYRSNTGGIRTGMLCLLTGSACFLLFVNGVKALIRAMEPAGSNFLSDVQFAGGIVSSVFLFVPSIFWGITAFRPERDPALTLLLNDASWLLLITAVPPFVLQTVPVAVATLACRDRAPLLPRWFAYATLWVDLLILPGMLAFYFRSGPFAWNGLFPYWIPFATYGVWIMTLSILILQASRRPAI